MSDSLRPYKTYPTRLLYPWGFSRQEYWNRLPCPPPGDLPDAEIEPPGPVTPALQADSLTLSQWGSPCSPDTLILYNVPIPLPFFSGVLIWSERCSYFTCFILAGYCSSASASSTFFFTYDSPYLVSTISHFLNSTCHLNLSWSCNLKYSWIPAFQTQTSFSCREGSITLLSTEEFQKGKNI